VPAMSAARTSSTWRVLAALLVPLVAGASALAVDSAAQARSVGTGCAGAYGWPVAPFDRAHPIRGGFGDPRTVFRGRLSAKTLRGGEGSFSFHQGLDISAPDRSPVYAVSDGTVVRARGGRVAVECGTGRTFQYWHIDPVARVGQRAVAGRSLLGFVQLKREHVHLTHLENGRAVNPLSRQRLTPYRDSTMPKVLGISLGPSGLAAEAIDMPAIPVPGRWHGFPVSPALVSWRLEDSRGRVVIRTRIARDVRRTVPRNDCFWDTFARGTRQNWPVFAGRKQRGMTGRYVFALASRPFVSRLRDAGEYAVVVTAEDTAGNRHVRRLTFDFSPH
jgi:Peptidase family M23